MQAKSKTPEARRAYSAANREKTREWERERKAIPSVRIKYLVTQARQRANRRGICFDKNAFSEFLVTPPIECECCGVGLDYSTGRMNFSQRLSRSPSFDRIDNAIGYEVGNVAAICTRCNSIKTDASAAELRLVADYAARKSLRGHP